MKKHILRVITYGLLAIGVFALSQLAQAPALLFLKENGQSPLSVTQNMISLAIYWAVIIGVFALAHHLKLIKLKEKLSWKKLALFLISGEVAIWVVSFIGVLISLMMRDDILSTNQESINELMTLLPTSLMGTMVLVGAPILEEVSCRGLIPRMFSEKWQWLGYVLGAVLFGLAHAPTTLGTAVQYIGMGGVLSLVAYFSKRLEYSILLHFMHNSLAFALMLSQM